MSRAPRDERRWRARPLGGIAVRLLSYALPVAASLGTAWLLATLVPVPTTDGWRLVATVTVLAVSTIVLVLTERLARRLLPLSVLLRMTLAFPDTAPSRYKIARSAGRVSDIEAWLREAREQGLSDEPVQAAAELLTLVAALSRHDRGTRGHAERTRVFVDMLAEEMDLPVEDRDRLRWAALLHDIGKLHVPTSVLNKGGRPDEDEWELLKQHPSEGMALASALHGFLGPWADTIHHHHERWDGTGYPQQLAGSQISHGGRIVAVADAFEVMTAARPYKEPMSATAAREELTRCAGAQFDPAIVRAFLQISIGRLRWTIGPVAWLAQSPLLLGLGSRALEVGTAVSRGIAALAVGGATIVAGPAMAEPAPATGVDDLAPDQPETVTPSPAASVDVVDPRPEASPSPTVDDRPVTDQPIEDPTTDADDDQVGPGDDGQGDDDGGGGPPPPPDDDTPPPGGGDGSGGGLDDTVDDVVGGAGEVVDEIVDGVDEIVDDVVDGVDDVVGGVVGGVDDTLDGVIGAVDRDGDVGDLLEDGADDLDDVTDEIIDLTEGLGSRGGRLLGGG